MSVIEDAGKEKIKLTAFSRGAGCGCKIAPGVLSEILSNEKITPFGNLLVGNSSSDDAAVYDMGNGTALISTTDFFMPIVDDAFDFGRIAAANAVSDVYAMGGKPIMALAILGWPIDKLPISLAGEVMEGARKICDQINIPLAGGHSIDSAEPFFGLSVNGVVAISKLKKNNTAKEGDLIFITKPIGVGILSTAQKRGVLLPGDQKVLIDQLTQLNTIGEKLGDLHGVTAMTDITGFGLAGHLLEMAEGSGLSAQIEYSKIPLCEGVKHYLEMKIMPDATFRNWNSYSKKIDFEKGVDVMEAFTTLPDPQTNGGLLIAVNPAAVTELKNILEEFGLGTMTTPIGRFISQQGKVIIVTP